MSRPRVYSSVKQVGSGRFLDPKALARISRLDLLARALVEGFISGLHRSPCQLEESFPPHPANR